MSTSLASKILQSLRERKENNPVYLKSKPFKRPMPVKKTGISSFHLSKNIKKMTNYRIKFNLKSLNSIKIVPRSLKRAKKVKKRLKEVNIKRLSEVDFDKSQQKSTKIKINLR